MKCEFLLLTHHHYSNTCQRDFCWLEPVLPLFSWRPTYQGCVFSPTFPYRTNYKLQCCTFCAAPVCRSRVTLRVLSGAKDHGDFLKGGGVKTFTSTPPPLDIVRVTSPALRKIEKRPQGFLQARFFFGGGRLPPKKISYSPQNFY